MIENECRHNKRFRQAVDKYCRENSLTVEQALKQDEVKRMFRYYTDL